MRREQLFVILSVCLKMTQLLNEQIFAAGRETLTAAEFKDIMEVRR